MQHTSILAALAIAGASLLSSACSACMEDEQPIGSTLVTFGWGAPICKAGDALAAISAQLPQDLTLSLTGADGQSYTATVGVPIALPVGTYQVTAKNSPDKQPLYFRETGADAPGYTGVPAVEVNQSVVVAEKSCTVTLTPFYKCFALVYDTGQIQGVNAHVWTVDGERQLALTSETIGAVASGGFVVAFGMGDFASYAAKYPVRFTVTSTEGASRRREIASPSVGYYYMLNTEDLQGAQLSLVYPDWQAGELTL